VSTTRTTEDWRYVLGTGNWRAFAKLGTTIDEIKIAAALWEKELAGVERPWLCWNVDPDWCVVQQKLVREVGWTPVVGYDPRVGRPPLVEGAICIDFNAHFKLPTMWMHFPMEFVFLFCDRLAFWHSDLLVRRDVMRALADQFAALPDGATAAVAPKEGNLAFLYPKARRYWELVGCKTKGASGSQFENGAGWWMNIWLHPSNTDQMVAARKGYYYDHGAGVRFWHKRCRGNVHLIRENKISEGHCTRIGNKSYVIKSPNNFKRDLSRDLNGNFDLRSVCDKLDLMDI
jgi:hypothetical protein